MPFYQIALLVVGTVAACFAVAFWNKIREEVATWLRNNGLSHSALMDAWIKLDLIAGRVRCRIFGKTQKYGTQEISETTYDLNEIDDEDVQRELRARGYSEKNIMSQVY